MPSSAICHWAVLLCSISRNTLRTDGAGLLRKKRQEPLCLPGSQFFATPRTSCAYFHKANIIYLHFTKPFRCSHRIPPPYPFLLTQSLRDQSSSIEQAWCSRISDSRTRHVCRFDVQQVQDYFGSQSHC